LVALATLAAAGCGGSSNSTTANGTTPPGQTLALGASATVPDQPVSDSQSAPAKFKLRVTVSAMEKGKLSDFKGGKVKVKMTNIGSGDAGSGGNPMVEMQGDSAGQMVQALVLYGTFPRCDYKQAPKPFSPGASFESCLVFLAPGSITAITYTGTEAYVDSPVSWK